MNLRDISFGLLYSVPEVYRQLDYHRIPVSHNCAGTNLWSLNLFSNCVTGVYLVQVNVNPIFGDQAHRALAVHVMRQWCGCILSSKIVALMTNNSNIMGHVKKINVDEAVEQGSGVEIFKTFLGPI